MNLDLSVIAHLGVDVEVIAANKEPVQHVRAYPYSYDTINVQIFGPAKGKFVRYGSRGVATAKLTKAQVVELIANLQTIVDNT